MRTPSTSNNAPAHRHKLWYCKRASGIIAPFLFPIRIEVPAMPRGDQLTRQWTLVQLLAGRTGRTLAQLTGEMGVSKRTVQRDLEVLMTAGFPVTSDMRNGTAFWHFMEGFHAETSLALTLTEQMALYFSKGLFKPLQGTPLYQSLESAIQKIGSQLPAQSFKFLRGLGQGISVSSFGLKDFSHSKQVVETLTRAVFRSSSCAFSIGQGIGSTPPSAKLIPTNSGM